MDNNPVGKLCDPTVLRNELVKNWIEEAKVLYIGMTDRTLKKRIRELVRFGAGKSDNHKGGKYIWQLDDSHSLLVAWLPADEPRELENEMILSFKGTYGKRPFANLIFSRK